MRALQVLVLVLAVLWGGYWFAGSWALKRGADAWFEAQAGIGVIAQNESLSVQGFPSRFDLTVNKLRLGDPAFGVLWTAPFVQILSLSYKPWHVIAAFAPEQHLITPYEDVTITSGKLQASLIVKPGPALTLDRVTLVGDALNITSSVGWSFSAKTVRLASRQLHPDGHRHDIGLEVLGLTPDAGFLALVPGLPDEIDRFHLAADLSFSAPLDRYAGETRPQLVGADLTGLTITWGTLKLEGSGQLVADANGMAEGRINLRLTNWRQMVPVAVALGWFTPEVAPTWENMLGALATQSGDPENLDLPLTFRNGRMSVGPLPFGTAPRMN